MPDEPKAAPKWTWKDGGNWRALMLNDAPILSGTQYAAEDKSYYVEVFNEIPSMCDALNQADAMRDALAHLGEEAHRLGWTLNVGTGQWEGDVRTLMRSIETVANTLAARARTGSGR